MPPTQIYCGVRVDGFDRVYLRLVAIRHYNRGLDLRAPLFYKIEKKLYCRFRAA